MIVLRHARLLDGTGEREGDVSIERGRVQRLDPSGAAPRADAEADLRGLVLLPGLVNAHDHLDFSVFPALGRPPYENAYAWAEDVDLGAADPRVREALAVPLVDRLFLGGLRNLLAGVAAVAHHNPFHRSMARRDFPVRVLAKYDFAHSPGFTPHLRKTYRTTDRRIPWMVHAAEGTGGRCQGEVAALAEANVLRQNTVIIHGITMELQDVERIARARASVVWCPESNRWLYGATAPVAALREAGVAIGLGSDSPVSGVRDPLSNLAAARREAVLSDDELLTLATGESAAVARLPVGGFEVGAPADLLAVTATDELLAGSRRAVALIMVGGEAKLGLPRLLNGLGRRVSRCWIEGEERALDEGVARRAAGLSKTYRVVRDAAFLAGVQLEH